MFFFGCSNFKSFKVGENEFIYVVVKSDGKIFALSHYSDDVVAMTKLTPVVVKV